MNWGKCEALWCGRGGEGSMDSPPRLPGEVRWGREGIKFLGVFLGSGDFKKKNWEGIVETVCAKLSSWKWLLPQLSYRGRVLIINNLVASALWHKMTVLEPPRTLIKEIQQKLVDFFWSGQHWIKAAALYLPVVEGGQGLVDVESRVAAFRLQAAQRLLYVEGLNWAGAACHILRKAGRLGLDRHLFLMELKGVDLSGLTPFYQAMLKAWTVFKTHRMESSETSYWGDEEPLFNNPSISVDSTSCSSPRNTFVQAGVTKIRHLRTAGEWRTAEEVAAMVGVRSVRLVQKYIEEVRAALPEFLKAALQNQSTSGKEEEVGIFPDLPIMANTGEWQEREGLLLTFRTPQLKVFRTTSKKALYQACMKVLHLRMLGEVKESRAVADTGTDLSPKGSWRSLYKRPIEKRVGDLQWRIVHGAIATNRYKAHLDPLVQEECLFCGVSESVSHIFTKCVRLGGLLQLVREWSENLGETFTENNVFIWAKVLCGKKETEHTFKLPVRPGKAGDLADTEGQDGGGSGRRPSASL